VSQVAGGQAGPVSQVAGGRRPGEPGWQAAGGSVSQVAW